MNEGYKGKTLAYRKIEQLEFDPIFLEYMQRPLFRQICADVYGPRTRIACHRAMFFNKPAEGGVPLGWHQDGRNWNLSVREKITIYTALDAQTKENGCLTVIPYSHKECPMHTVRNEKDIQKYAPEKNRMYMELEKGEVVLQQIKLLHSSLVNTTHRPRRAFSIAFIDANAYCTHSGERYPQVLPDYQPVEKH
mgnify:CR=1 FL=1